MEIDSWRNTLMLAVSSKGVLVVIGEGCRRIVVGMEGAEAVLARLEMLEFGRIQAKERRCSWVADSEE